MCGIEELVGRGQYPLSNMGLGCAECFAELGLLGFGFGQRTSKLWHEVRGERSLEQTGGNVFPGTPALAFLWAGGVFEGSWEVKP